jgi:Outer membrane lipoprotein-sorting protein
MPLRRARLALAVGYALLPAAPSLAEEPKTAEQIQSCIEGNLPEKSSLQSIALVSKDRLAAITESKAVLRWKKSEDGRSRVLIEFSQPEDLRGASVLLLERRKPGDRDMFMYLPELHTVKRITSRMVTGSMFGTDFSYEDFEMIEDYARKHETTRIADAQLDGATAWVLESRPAAGQMSGYTRILEYIDPATCVRLKTELFEANDRLRKVASSDRKTITEVSGLHYAPTLTLRDVVKQTETDLSIEKIEVGVDIPDRLFSQTQLTKGK